MAKKYLTTLYDQHVIKAFEINALDYLLKSIVVKRLSEAVHKVLEKHRIEEGGLNQKIGIGRSGFCKRTAINAIL